MDLAKTTVRQDEKYLGLGIWCDLDYMFDSIKENQEEWQTLHNAIKQ